MINSIKNKLSFYNKFLPFSDYSRTYQLFKDFTMIGKVAYIKNLVVAEKAQSIEGCVVECGVWKGGMIAGIAKQMGDSRRYYLFDSFEGLPEAKEIDGEKARKWQQRETDQPYFDNCSADISYAQQAMQLSGASNFFIRKGWFKDTLPHFEKSEKIAVLRMDGDWYESTYQILENLYPYVQPGGVIIIDDYGAWEGCSKAIHDYLSRNSLNDKIYQFENEIFFIIKPGS